MCEVFLCFIFSIPHVLDDFVCFIHTSFGRCFCVLFSIPHILGLFVCYNFSIPHVLNAVGWSDENHYPRNHHHNHQMNLCKNEFQPSPMCNVIMFNNVRRKNNCAGIRIRVPKKYCISNISNMTSDIGHKMYSEKAISYDGIQPSFSNDLL